jgi:hypothetical protein
MNKEFFKNGLVGEYSEFVIDNEPIPRQKPIALIGTFIKNKNEALDLAEKKSINGQEFSVVECGDGFLLVNDKILNEATK